MDLRTYHRDGWVHDVEQDRYMEKAQANGDLVFAEKCPEGFYPMTLMKWKGQQYQVSKKIEIMVNAKKTEEEALQIMDQSEKDLSGDALKSMNEYLDKFNSNPEPMVEKRRGRPKKV